MAEAEEVSVRLFPGDLVSGRWMILRPLDTVGHCWTYLVDDTLHVDRAATLWMFDDRKRGRAEALLRERVQSSGIAAFVDSGAYGEGWFICTAHYPLNLRSLAGDLRDSGAPVEALHRLAASVSHGLIRALRDMEATESELAARSGGRSHHGRISPESVLVRGPTAVLAHLGDAGDPAAHRSVGDESASFRPPDVELSYDSEPVDIWMVGSLIHWVFTGEPASARPCVDKEPRIPEGWRPFLRGSLAPRSGARVSLAELERRIPAMAHLPPVEQSETWAEFGRLIRRKLQPVIGLTGAVVQATTDRLVATARAAPTSAVATVVVAAMGAWWMLGRPTDPSGIGSAAAIGMLVGFGVAMGRMVVGAAGLFSGQWLGVAVTGRVSAISSWRSEALVMLGTVGATLVIAWIREFHRDATGVDPARVEESTALLEGGRAAIIGTAQQLGVMAIVLGLLPSEWMTAGRSVLVWVLLAMSVAAWDATGAHVGQMSVAEPRAFSQATRRLLVAPVRALSAVPAFCTTRRARGFLIAGAAVCLAAALAFVAVFRTDMAEFGSLAERQLAWQWLDSAPVLVALVVPLILLAGAAASMGFPALSWARAALSAMTVLAGLLAVRAAWSSEGQWARVVLGAVVASTAGAMVAGAYGRLTHRDAPVTTLRNGLVILASLGAAFSSLAWSVQYWTILQVEDERVRSFVGVAEACVPDGWRPGSFAPVDALSAPSSPGGLAVGVGRLTSDDFEPAVRWLRSVPVDNGELGFAIGDSAVGPVFDSTGSPDPSQRLVVLAVTVDRPSGVGGSVDLTDRVALVFLRSGSDPGGSPLGDYRSRALAPSGDAVGLDIVIPTFLGDVDGNGTLDQPIGPVLDFSSTPRLSFALAVKVPVEADLRLLAVVVGEGSFAASARLASGADPRPELEAEDLALVASTGTWAPTPGPIEQVGLDEIRLERR